MAEKKRREEKNLRWAGKWGTIWSLVAIASIPITHFLLDQHYVQGGIEFQWMLTALMAIVVILGLIVVYKTRKER